MASATAEACPDCGMMLVENKGVTMCPSEDFVQPMENEINPVTGDPVGRTQTKEDRLHNAAWSRKIKEWYEK